VTGHERRASAFHLLSLSLSLSTIAQTAKKLLAVCDDEWKSLVIFRFYIGARLGDLAMLTWQNLGLGSNEPQDTAECHRPAGECATRHARALSLVTL